MLEYAFESIPSSKGLIVGKTKGHREIIARRAAEGWRYAGFIPTEQTNGYVTMIDLVFERERPEG